MKRPLGRLRIIGGQWRSRLIDFDPAHGVRPTPDRVRQVLFDWLSPLVDGANCLDLFAGSGALGLEALSRGAQRVCFVERGSAQAASIRVALDTLEASGRADVIVTDAITWLLKSAAASHQTAQPYQLIFLDPPYADELLEPTLRALPPHLAPANRIYLEWPKGAPPAVPPGYSWLKEKSAGQVSYGLLQYSEIADDTV